MSDEPTPYGRLFPPLPRGVIEPFWFGSLQSFWRFYRADPEAVAARLPTLPGNEGLEVALSRVRRAGRLSGARAVNGSNPR